MIPYSMGPITLGTKPITDGESYWPANLQHPFGETIMEGDNAYVGGNYLVKGWMDSSRFFLNGFRNLEFGVTDTYLPLQFFKAQKVVLKEETSQFFGGQTIERRVNVHNDVFHDSTLTLHSSLVTPDGRALDQG